MKIAVYGTGCKSCKTLFKNAQKAGAKVGAEVEYVTDLRLILEKGYMTMPVLEKDGVVISKGKVLSPAEIEALI